MREMVGGEKRESQPKERESEREAGGSWRNIKEGGIEEECVMGREKRRRKEWEYIFFSVLRCQYSNFVLLFSPLCSKANTFFFLKRKGIFKESYGVLCLLPLPFLFLVSFLL